MSKPTMMQKFGSINASIFTNGNDTKTGQISRCLGRDAFGKLLYSNLSIRDQLDAHDLKSAAEFLLKFLEADKNGR